jgi:multiple sugar transport system substrate-binding protein
MTMRFVQMETPSCTSQRRPTPAHPTWSTLELALRTGVSETLQGQKTAKQALDAVAADWQRTLRRAGVGRA